MINVNSIPSVGFDNIDEQHTKMIELFNQLHLTVIYGHGKDVLQQLLNAIVEYSKFHFDSEEKLMYEISYPRLGIHRQEHQALMDKLIDVVDNFSSGKIIINSTTLTELEKWLVKHIDETDSLLATWSKEAE